jgi:acyl-lipid omega-6 desaturase (Delta-12 desaturase)
MTPQTATETSATRTLPSISEWKEIVAEYQVPSTPRAVWQLVNTIGSYIALWYLMYLSLSVSYWLTALLAVITGGIVIRAFIIFHDCGHGSFLASKRANDIIGFITGMITFTPYFHWRWEHSLHHATSGDLDRRGIGDVWTLTVQEYIESSRWKRFAYRLARNPVILFVIAPVGLFLIYQRIPNPKASPREKQSVHWMNFALLCMAAGMSWIFGFWTYLVLQLCVMAVSGAAGVWMFYVQHQFEDVYWERRENWDYTAAAIEGSSFYKLPKILQWFTGNIGFHHIHHLSSRIPNYNLERCHHSHPLFSEVKPLTLFSSLKSSTLRLWDEQQKKLVGWKRMREVRHEMNQRKAEAETEKTDKEEAAGSMTSHQR